MAQLGSSTLEPLRRWQLETDLGSSHLRLDCTTRGSMPTYFNCMADKLVLAPGQGPQFCGHLYRASGAPSQQGSWLVNNTKRTRQKLHDFITSFPKAYTFTYTTLYSHKGSFNLMKETSTQEVCILGGENHWWLSLQSEIKSGIKTATSALLIMPKPSTV